MKMILTSLILIASTVLKSGYAAAPHELEYPRVIDIGDNALRVHHPVIDQWDQFARVEGWIPVEVILAGSPREWVGAVRASAKTEVDLARRLVTLSDQQVLDVRFSQADPPREAIDLAHQAVQHRDQVIVLDTLLSALAGDFKLPSQGPAPVNFNNSPPRIIVTTQDTQLLLIDRVPVATKITGTELESVINTDWSLFRHVPSNSWYVLNEGTWQTHSMLATGGWTSTTELPPDFRQLALSDEWPAVRDALPAQLPDHEPSPFVISLEPTELISIDGPARLEAVGEEGLRHVANTNRNLFELNARWYFLTAGRWFETATLKGPWQPVNALPAEFKTIPHDHPRAGVRASVPGTMEAVASMMEASLPRRRSVTHSEAASLQVGYVGTPQFELIEGTDVSRAVNSPNYIFLHNNFYYLCYEAAWFHSSDPAGPWSTARTIPQGIYAIPPTDPAYFVTFVKPAAVQPEQSSEMWFEHNAGYVGEYSTGVTVVQGTGWYYPPWVWYDPMGLPVYWSYPHTYGWPRYGYGPYNRFYHYGGYWGSQRITLESEPMGMGSNSYDPAFQDPRLARRGYDYSTIQQRRNAEFGRPLNAGDDYYTDNQGNVYRQEQGQWSQHTGDGWSTMAELERQYGTSSYGASGQVTAPQQRQAYKQNPYDIERMKRYHDSRQRSFNMYGYVSVYR